VGWLAIFTFAIYAGRDPNLVFVADFSSRITMATASVTSIVERIAAAGKAYEGDERGSREALIDLGRDLVAALEIPSEFLQRSFWAEVCVATCNPASKS
jgi:hypothetical protein